MRTGTGGGITTVLRTLTAQLLHHGAHALILDTKRISHPCARDLPTVTYRADIADVHDALTELATDFRHRINHADHGGDVDDLPLPRLVVVFEAADTALRQLTRYLLEHHPTQGRPEDVPGRRLPDPNPLRGAPGAHPRVLRRGATSDIFGPSAREQFATVVLARVTANTWDRLAPVARPAPKDSMHPGRVHVVHDGTARPTQVLTLTDDEAAGWAADTS